MITSLLLALQWGGVTKPWSDRSVIACFCVVKSPYHPHSVCFCCSYPDLLLSEQFGALLPIFIGWEFFRGDRGILPLKLFRNRTQVGACLATVSETNRSGVHVERMSVNGKTLFSFSSPSSSSLARITCPCTTRAPSSTRQPAVGSISCLTWYGDDVFLVALRYSTQILKLIISTDFLRCRGDGGWGTHR